MALAGGLGCPGDGGGGDEGAADDASGATESADDDADPSAGEDDDDPSDPSAGPGPDSDSDSDSETATTSGTGTDTLDTDGETDPSDTANESDSDTSTDYECPPPAGSVCSNGNSIIGGRVQLAPGIDDDGTGSVVVILSHKALGGGSAGGIIHTADAVSGADLATAPVEFQLDMCTGGMMWSEDNCGYQLTVILDKNGNNGAGNILPDPGEPTWRTDLDLSCNGPPPCFDIELDCVDGASCASFADGPYCGCNPPGTCGSDIQAC